MQAIAIFLLATIACIQAAPAPEADDEAWGEPRG